MGVNKIKHLTGRKTGCNRSRPFFFGFSIFLTNIATGKWKNSEFVQPQPVVRSFAVGFSLISVFFQSSPTGPANTRLSGWGCKIYACPMFKSQTSHQPIVTVLPFLPLTSVTDLTQWLRLHARYKHSLGSNPRPVTNLTDYFLLPGVTLFYHQLDCTFQNVIQDGSITFCYKWKL